MAEYTPTDEQVRDAFVWLSAGDNPGAHDLAEEDYDRWMAAHDARVKAEALRSAADELHETPAKLEGGLPMMLRAQWLWARADRIEQEASR